MNSLSLPCESFVKETGSINEDEPWFVAGGFWNNFCLSRSKGREVQTTNCNSAKTVAKAIYSRKKRTRQLNLMFPIILITYFFQIHNWRTWKHYNLLKRAHTTSTFINIFNNIFSYVKKKRKSVSEEKCWHLASCKSPVSKRTITRIGSENLENNAYHG